MTTEHDEALVERVALAMVNAARRASRAGVPVTDLDVMPANWRIDARAVCYPPAPPKTRLQVARELLNADGCGLDYSDHSRPMQAVLSALALDKMED